MRCWSMINISRRVTIPLALRNHASKANPEAPNTHALTEQKRIQDVRNRAATRRARRRAMG
jgi:hypothetical protein